VTGVAGGQAEAGALGRGRGVPGPLSTILWQPPQPSSPRLSETGSAWVVGMTFIAITGSECLPVLNWSSLLVVQIHAVPVGGNLRLGIVVHRSVFLTMTGRARDVLPAVDALDCVRHNGSASVSCDSRDTGRPPEQFWRPAPRLGFGVWVTASPARKTRAERHCGVQDPADHGEILRSMRPMHPLSTHTPQSQAGGLLERRRGRAATSGAAARRQRALPRRALRRGEILVLPQEL